MRVGFSIILITMSLLTGLEALAFISYPSSRLGLPERFETHAKSSPWKGHLRFTGSHFMTDQRTASESENYGYLGGSLDYRSKSETFDWAANAIFEGSINPEHELYYGVPELFVRLTEEKNNVQVSVGRQIRTWSEFDRRLGLGIWQPQLRWDYLNPIQQGLTGAFFDMDAQPLHVMLFASPIFLPDQGPQFRLNNGRFESSSRWFWQPQTRLRLGEESSNLYYEMDAPRPEEIVMNPSLGGMIEINPVGPFQFQMAYAFKPMNQFFIGIECTGCVDPLTTDGTAQIHPSVVNHHVFTAESSWEHEDDKFLLSWTIDRPVDPKIPKDWWAGTELKPVHIPAVAYERRFSILSRSLILGVDYFQEVSAGSSIGGGDPSRSVESSVDRYSFADLLSVNGSLRLFGQSKTSLTWTVRYSYSTQEKGSWLNSRMTYRKNALEGFLAVDVLGSLTDPLSPDAGLFSRYRSNDRVYGGVGYVF